MKSFAVIVALGLITFAQAQDQCAAVAAKVPSCATQCIASAASGVGCSETDFACQCKPANNAAINSAALNCVIKGCGAQTGLAVQASASAVCACAATAGGSGSTTSAAAPASTTAAQAASTSSPAKSSSAVQASSPATPATSAAAPFPSSSSVKAAPAGTVSASGTGAVTPSSSTTPFTGAGVKIISSIGAAMFWLVAVITVL